MKSISAINPVTMKNMDDFCLLQMQKEAKVHCRKLTHCHVIISEKKWDTKEDEGKSMVHALCVRYAKRHLLG